MSLKKPTWKNDIILEVFQMEEEVRKRRHPKYITIRNLEYVKWIKQFECVVCHAPGPSDPNHIWNTGGGGGKYQDLFALPFCRGCHSEYHHVGHEKFESIHEIEFELELLKFLSFYVQYGVGRDN